jgi:hypothetical protein
MFCAHKQIEWMRFRKYDSAINDKGMPRKSGASTIIVPVYIAHETGQFGRARGVLRADITGARRMNLR